MSGRQRDDLCGCCQHPLVLPCSLCGSHEATAGYRYGDGEQVPDEQLCRLCSAHRWAGDPDGLIASGAVTYFPIGPATKEAGEA